MKKGPDYDNDKRNYGIKQYFLVMFMTSVGQTPYEGKTLPFLLKQTCDDSSRLMFLRFPSHIKENNSLIYKLSF